MSSWFWVVLAEFWVLVLLGIAFRKLLAWEETLKSNRELWIHALRQMANQLKTTRRQLEKAEDQIPSLDQLLGRSPQLLAFRWMFKVFSSRQQARP